MLNTSSQYAATMGGKMKGKPKQAKVKKVMHEFKAGKLHSGSKTGPKVQKRSQAIAIAMSEARKKAGKRGRA